ncbi:rhodanese-like domain-containing protein [Planctomicrobium sp. SH661]|uniref:rhodanese-like domain-containing protein n=1 Tax=Planctomicrobium sp. SH661 TaxID=3448124 RepID=UPI003F5B07E9
MTTSDLPIEVDCETVRSLQADGEQFLFLDCREQDEYDVARIEGAVLLPMSEMQSRVDELESSRDARIVVHCHHGGRSLRVANWLRNQGFSKTQSMAGGIDAWSLRIDPEVPRY